MSEVGLWAHQSAAISRAKEMRDLALFMEPGVGKTATIIHIYRDKCNAAKQVIPALILAPLVVTPQWKREFAKFSKVPEDRILVLNKSGVKRLKDFKQWNEKHKGNFIVVTNYEALLTQEFYLELLTWGPSFLVLDESHRVKDSQSKRYKLLKGLADAAQNRYILTGTPVLNSPLDLFAQYRLLDGGTTFGDNFFAFRALYMYDKNAGMPKHVYFPNWQPRPDAAPRLALKLSQTAVQARKEECLTLPPFVRTEVPIELGKEQKKAYEEMKKIYVTQVQEKIIAAQLAITQTIRLQTILAGFIVNPDNPEKPLFFEDNPRLDALVELLTDLTKSGKVLVWTNFVATYGMIGKALEKAGISSVCLTGQQSANEKEENVKEFTKGAAQVAICNPQAVGLGITLVEAKYAVYYTRSYSLEHDIQSEARNFRGGSEMHDKITRYDLVVPETLDEIVLKALRGKSDLASAVLNWAQAGIA